MRQLTFQAMGSHMLVAMAADTPSAARRIAQVPLWFARWEACLSRFRPESELSELNDAGGRPTRVSRTLWRVFQAAQDGARASGGLVVPTVLPALEAAGYDRTFAAMEPVGARRKATSSVEPLAAVVADAPSRTITLPGGARLDFGGVAKGWAADAVARRVGRYAPTLIDVGGDIAVSGPPSEGELWPVGVADPFAPERQLTLLRIASGGVATSGRDYRRWRRDGQWLHHIIDPRTGQPANTDVVSATVVAPTAREAEVAAKVAFILGSGAGLAWLDERPTLAGVLVRENGEAVASRRFEQYVWK